MSRPREPVEVRRIVVAVDASPHSQAALEAAVAMAARLGAELLGLYVEDVNVLRIAGLPYGDEFGVYSAQRRRISSTDVERQFRVRSRRVRDSFRELSQRNSLRSTFRVTRGNVNSEIQSAAADADVLIVGRVGWSQLRERQVGSTARALCGATTAGVTAVLQHGTQLAPPVLVIYDGSVSAERALAFAARLVGDPEMPLEVLVVAQDAERLEVAADRLRDVLAELGVVERQHRMVLPSVHDLIQAVRIYRAQTLVVPGCLRCLDEDGTVSLLEQVEIPVLLVR